MTTHFVAFGRHLELPGFYRKEAFPKEGIPAFCKNDGIGFWSLVKGSHAVLICMEVLQRTVTDRNIPPVPGLEIPWPEIGDEILFVIPEEGSELLPDHIVNDYDSDTPVSYPPCALERWIRLS